MYNFQTEKVTKNLINWISHWFEEKGKGCNAIIGISGGKDSSVVAALCCKALGTDRVIGIMMPNGDQKDISDSIKLCEFLGIKNHTINIKPMVDTHLAALEAIGDPISEQTITNLPARVRMNTLYSFSQSHNGRVSNNCNLSENTVGYATRWGDGAGDFSPLGQLTTVEIQLIGDYLGLPYELVHKTPIDGLKTNADGSYVTDEQSLGITYQEIHDYLRNKANNPYIRELKYKNLFKLCTIPEYYAEHRLLYTFNALCIVDMQNDFIKGSLANNWADKTVPNIIREINSGKYDRIIVTKDTHESDYLASLEGQKLPIEHCISGTWGWEIDSRISDALDKFGRDKVSTFTKSTFGIDSAELDNYADTYTVVGTCTDICVLSMALSLKHLENTPVRVLSNCCSPSMEDEKKQEAAFEMMRSCQIDVI